MTRVVPAWDRIRARVNDGVPFARHCGIEVTDLGGRHGIATLTAEPHLANHVASLQAGALFSVAEAASGACAVGLLGGRFDTLLVVVRGGTIEYRRPAHGQTTATARTDTGPVALGAQIDAKGKADFQVDVELTDGAGVHVARATFVWHARRPEAAQ